MAGKQKKASREKRLARGRKMGVGKPRGVPATWWNANGWANAGIILVLTLALSGCGIIYSQRSSWTRPMDCKVHSLLLGAISWETCK